MFITSPTYEGLHANLDQIIQAVREIAPDMVVIVDNAWDWGLDSPLSQGADIAVRSSHKMDGACQGGAILLANKERLNTQLLEECITARRND